MSRARRGDGRAGKLPLLVSVTLALAAMWFGLRQAADLRWAATRPEWAIALWPASSTALGLMALNRTMAGDGIVDEPARQLAAQALVRGPAEALPLALAGLDASAAGKLDRATTLMAMARARNPRLPMVRVWLLNEYVRQGRFGEALAEAGPVMRLVPQSRPQVYALIARIAAQPQGELAVQAALAQAPDWRMPYQQWLAQNRSAAGSR